MNQTPFRSLRKILALVLLLGLGAALAETHDDDVVTIMLGNVGSRAWVLNGVEGADGVGEMEAQNASLTLQVGQRYRFDVSDVNSNVHPLELRDADGNALLSQGRSAGSFADDEEVAFEVDDDSLTFTLSEALAAELALYRCIPHRSMEAEITIVTDEG